MFSLWDAQLACKAIKRIMLRTLIKCQHGSICLLIVIVVTGRATIVLVSVFKNENVQSRREDDVT